MNGPQRFRKNPVVIEAVQMRGYTEGPAIVGWINTNGGEADMGGSYYDNSDPGPAYLIVKTLEGNMRADVGDWIIRGVAGEFYPCKRNIFRATYEVAE